MLLIYFMVAILMMAFLLFGVLLFYVKKEEKKNSDDSAQPIIDLEEVLRSAQPRQSKTGGSPMAVEAGSLVRIEELPDVPKVKEDPAFSSGAPLEQEKFPASFYEGAPALVDLSQDQPVAEEIGLLRQKMALQERDSAERINSLILEKEKLSAENAMLLAEGKAVSGKELEFSHLKAENSALKAELDSCKNDLAASVKELESARSEFAGQMACLKPPAKALMPEKMAPLPEGDGGQVGTVDMSPGQPLLMASEEEASVLQKAMDILRAQKEGLALRVRELESLLAAQSEKNSFLQYELTKSRVQAAGLDRVCENSKQQLESLSRQVQDASFDRRELNKYSALLMNGLAEFKRLNAEFVRREDLSQFEVQKNRDEISDLERIYSGFLSRLEASGFKEEDLAADIRGKRAN
jgi:hypothetical protein